MKIHFSVLTVTGLMLALITFQTFGANLSDAPVTFRSGNWKVVRTLDAMNDKVTCTGIYKDDYSVQLNEGELYVSIRGGLQSITMRFDENPARKLRIPLKMEKDIGAVMLTGNDFNELRKSSRLRIQTATLVRGIEEKDLDLTGISETLQHMQSGCPLPVSPVVPPKKTGDSTCSITLINKMKAQGITPDKISAICSPN